MNTGIFELLGNALSGTLLGILPIILVLGFFQIAAIRKVIPHLKQKLVGLVLVVLGLGIFIVGLEQCVFPIGTQMAHQLTDLLFLAGNDAAKAEVLKNSANIAPGVYLWTYIFAFLIGFSTTLAEPALIAVAYKARDITTGAISAWGLRISVALGVAGGVTLGVYRIVTGSPLHYYIVTGYALLLIQTWFAPKQIIPLAYDSGGGNHLNRNSTVDRCIGDRISLKCSRAFPLNRRLRPDSIRLPFPYVHSNGVCYDHRKTDET